MTLLDEIEKGLANYQKYGRGQYGELATWESIAALVDYIRAAEEQFNQGRMPYIFSRAERLQAARAKLGLTSPPEEPERS